MFANKLWLAVALVTALTGCGRKDTQEIAAGRAADAEYNRAAFAAPELIGVLNNGVPVHRVSVKKTSEYTGGTTKEHFIYIVDGSRVQTVNWSQQEGKVEVPYTQATIQIPSTTTPAEIIKMGEDLKRQQDDAERAQWKKLDQKYGNKP